MNAAELEPEEVPTKDDTTFMIAPAPVNSQQGATGGVESLIIFCVDISGSMCVTTEVHLYMLCTEHPSMFLSFKQCIMQMMHKRIIIIFSLYRFIYNI